MALTLLATGKQEKILNEEESRGPSYTGVRLFRSVRRASRSSTKDDESVGSAFIS